MLKRCNLHLHNGGTLVNMNGVLEVFYTSLTRITITVFLVCLFFDLTVYFLVHLVIFINLVNVNYSI